VKKKQYVAKRYLGQKDSVGGDPLLVSGIKWYIWVNRSEFYQTALDLMLSIADDMGGQETRVSSLNEASVAFAKVENGWSCNRVAIPPPLNRYY
jgi:hypothetical protein